MITTPSAILQRASVMADPQTCVEGAAALWVEAFSALKPLALWVMTSRERVWWLWSAAGTEGWAGRDAAD